MGMKNQKNKSNLLKKEGFYVVLFICLCVVAVIAVYISKTNSLKQNPEVAKKETTKVEEKMQDAQQVKKEEEAVATMKNAKKEEAAKKDTKEKSESKKEESKENSKENDKETSAKKATISLTMPVKGEVIKQFSKQEMQYTKSLDLWETHEAVNIGCSLGDEVKSAAKGKVVEIYNDEKVEKSRKSGYGLTVVIEHENGFRTVYANLADNVKVKKGETVNQGAVIGVVGDTSVREAVKDNGPHLHFGLLQKKDKDYETVDPLNYIKK